MLERLAAGADRADACAVGDAPVFWAPPGPGPDPAAAFGGVTDTQNLRNIAACVASSIPTPPPA
jgi:hypothetical protein